MILGKRIKQPTEREKISANDMTDKGLISNIYKPKFTEQTGGARGGKGGGKLEKLLKGVKR